MKEELERLDEHQAIIEELKEIRDFYPGFFEFFSIPSIHERFKVSAAYCCIVNHLDYLLTCLENNEVLRLKSTLFSQAKAQGSYFLYEPLIKLRLQMLNQPQVLDEIFFLQKNSMSRLEKLGRWIVEIFQWILGLFLQEKINIHPKESALFKQVMVEAHDQVLEEIKNNQSYTQIEKLEQILALMEKIKLNPHHPLKLKENGRYGLTRALAAVIIKAQEKVHALLLQGPFDLSENSALLRNIIALFEADVPDFGHWVKTKLGLIKSHHSLIIHEIKAGMKTGNFPAFNTPYDHSISSPYVINSTQPLEFFPQPQDKMNVALRVNHLIDQYEASAYGESSEEESFIEEESSIHVQRDPLHEASEEIFEGGMEERIEEKIREEEENKGLLETPPKNIIPSLILRPVELSSPSFSFTISPSFTLPPSGFSFELEGISEVQRLENQWKAIQIEFLEIMIEQEGKRLKALKTQLKAGSLSQELFEKATKEALANLSRAFRRFALKIHPDKHRQSPEIQEKATKVSQVLTKLYQMGQVYLENVDNLEVLHRLLLHFNIAVNQELLLSKQESNELLKIMIVLLKKNIAASKKIEKMMWRHLKQVYASLGIEIYKGQSLEELKMRAEEAQKKKDEKYKAWMDEMEKNRKEIRQQVEECKKSMTSLKQKSKEFEIIQEKRFQESKKSIQDTFEQLRLEMKAEIEKLFKEEESEDISRVYQ